MFYKHVELFYFKSYYKRFHRNCKDNLLLTKFYIAILE